MRVLKGWRRAWGPIVRFGAGAGESVDGRVWVVWAEEREGEEGGGEEGEGGGRERTALSATCAVGWMVVGIAFAWLL